MASNERTFPRAPILDWNSFASIGSVDTPCVADLPNRVITTSGRAALYQALLQLCLPAGATVLVPTYHCPTMVAPALLAGLKVEFYPLGDDGLPFLSAIGESTLARARAIIVAHYFGLPQSLSAVRTWCDQHRIALIEDCAHCLFGYAGEQAVGSWGDFATASFSKFLPVPEAGLLASARREIKPVDFQPRTLSQQFKGLVDVLELSARHACFRPIDLPLRVMFDLKNSRRHVFGSTFVEPASAAEDMMRQCDMGRIDQAPLWISSLLSRQLPKGRNIAQRRQNFATYLAAFQSSSLASPLRPALPEHAVPYVFPLWVEDCDRIYAEIRARQLPVFRWDRIWPGTPDIRDDTGAAWSRQVLQLLCHQTLQASDVVEISNEIKSLL